MTADEQVVNVRLPVALHAAVRERAKAEDRTMAQTVRVALRHYLATTEPLAPAAAASGPEQTTGEPAP